MLLDNQDDTVLFKQWALLAKKAKEYYHSSEAKLIGSLFDVCLSSETLRKTPTLSIRFLDFLNQLLASNSDASTRRYLVYFI
jgi:hypothetical protein